MLLDVIILIVLVCFYVDVIYPHVIYRFLARKHKTGMPKIIPSYPLGIPITYKLIKAVANEKWVKLALKLSKKINACTYLQESLFKYVIYSQDPENLKAVLATQFNDFSIAERTSQITPVFGSGIFTQDGVAWKHSRAMLRPQFSKEQVSRLEHVLSHVGQLVISIDQRHGLVNVVPLFHMLTMDTATEFLFGESVDSLKFSDVTDKHGNNRGSYVTTTSGKQVYAADFVESYTFLNEYALKRMMLNSLHNLLKFIKPGFETHLETAQSFIDFYVERALHYADNIDNSDAQQKADEDDLTGNYIFSYELAKETRDPIAIRDQCFNILIAGRDTTASTLSFAFYYFALYPETWRRVREEVFSVFTPEDGDDQITYESLRKLKYVQMFVKEVLRLHPVVPLNTKSAERDTTLPRGGGPNEDQPIFVPKGMAVNYSVYVMHRDKSIYGADAEEFVPERWDSQKNKNHNNAMYTWGYLPFSGGPRICLGQQFALTELHSTIAKLAMQYRCIEKGPNFPMELKQRNTLTLAVGGDGLPVRFVR